MARSTKSKPITAESVKQALDAGAQSLTEVARSLGFKGRPGSTTTAAIRKAVPDVDERLKANKAGKGAKPGTAEAATAKKPKAAVKANWEKAYPRHPSNPYREGSAYATAYDILADAGEKGIVRKDLVAEAARLTGKDERRAYYDVTVVLSPRETGEAHRSANRAADAYWVEKADGGNVKLRLRDRRF